jgi:hypothetical protein
MYKRDDIVKDLKKYVIEVVSKQTGVAYRITLREDLTPEYFKTLNIDDFHKNCKPELFLGWNVVARTTQVFDDEDIVNMQVVDSY